MYTSERRNKILSILQETGSVSVNELTEVFNVSKATIRSDLNYLDMNNMLVRTHGGAVCTKEDEVIKVDKNYDIRKQKNIEKKAEIAKIAFQLIKTGECIILDASSTCYELAKLISQSDLRITVLTNGLRTASLLKENLNLTVILIGGVVKGTSNAVEGVLGIEILRKVNIDTLFTSSYAISTTGGLSDFNLYEVELKKRMVEFASQTIALVDSSKFEKKSIATFAALDQLTALITDSQLAREVREQYSSEVNFLK
ncbi:DeoR/GlpR transcriptional regulator [Enterococcus sp. BWB1-3]|uniref:DeoR/GlpR family DNA-binding transcription regulator n=1 Tax=Enterococcus sp. BWB1-3 TaxID=2787713 RepID=UPI0019232FC5|nr:DeoR/GlpR family DNA-binding transcription regulator [Enterococcus sp. BWB1-3]MBL1230457.1 DeoR/GlpR transcriptional regulator [Enterococcus sp. BWB1-3]